MHPVGNTVADIWKGYTAEFEGDARTRLDWVWKNLEPFFAVMTPDQIDREVCRSYAASRPVADGTILRELSCLRAALRWRDKNTPAQFWMPRAAPPRDRWLTREEFSTLLDSAEGPHIEMFLRLAIATAARKEAILDLRWDPTVGGPGHVDLGRREIFLGRKNGGKKRATVPMTTSLHTALTEAREVALSPWVVEYRGRPVGDIKKGFAQAVKRSGIERCTPHDIRHTAAVWMAGAGVAMSMISQYLGHSSTEVTERVYARYAPEHLKAAADALEI